MFSTLLRFPLMRRVISFASSETALLNRSIEKSTRLPNEMLLSPFYVPCHSFHAMQMNPSFDGCSLLAAESVVPVTVNQVRYFKYKTKLKRRCKDCYFVKEEGQRMVLCRSHPRHKQMKLMPKPETFWILTHATQHRKRPW